MNSGVVMFFHMKKGYTIIELICVIAIIGIMAGLSYPSIKGLLSSERLNLSSKVLINDLRYAKMYAVSKNITSVYVKFTGDADKGIYSGYMIYYPNNMANPVLINKNFDDEIIIDGKNSTFGTANTSDIIEFKPDGSVYPACTIVIRDTDSGDSKKITLTIGYTRIMEIK